MHTARPFVDRAVTDLSRADRAATVAAEQWGLRSPKLIRRGMNALYACDDVVLRVGDATAHPALAHQLVEALAEHGVPVVPPVTGMAETLGGLAVSAWRRIEATEIPIDWRVVGAAVRHVHEFPPELVPVGYPAPPPTAFPWWDFDGLLEEVGDHIDDAAIGGLRATVERHRGWDADVAHDPVVCHGDVHPGNVLVSAGGPLLIDWDLLCTANPAWDHAMLTTYAERWGGDAGTYAAFAEGYGTSLADDPLARAVGELRNVAATLMRVRAGVADPRAADEAERRLQYWRGDPHAPVWRAQ
jgi:Ser/Thr protein kinase RdoA (MazF antagonist)